MLVAFDGILPLKIENHSRQFRHLLIYVCSGLGNSYENNVEYI